jgi:transposase
MQGEILAGPERRRRWSAAEKSRIVAEMDAPGAQVAEIARRHGVSRGLLYVWRSLARRERDAATLPGLVPVVMAAKPSAPRGLVVEGGVIEIALPGDVQVTVRGQVDAKGLRAVLAALRP